MCNLIPLYCFQAEEPPGPTIRQLYTQLLLTKAPIVLHNAIVDLVFMYQTLYAELPGKQLKLKYM